MAGELAWLEHWCATRIEVAAPDDLTAADALAAAARIDSAGDGVDLGLAIASLHYATLEDYMLEQLASFADRMGLPRTSRSGYGHRAHQPDPRATYGFTEDRRGRTLRS